MIVPEAERPFRGDVVNRPRAARRRSSAISDGAYLVTGAAGGIGRACVELLDREGALVFAGVRKEADGEALRRVAARLVPVVLDVADESSISATAETIAERLGGRGLAGLVNNAGIAVTGPMEFVSTGDLRRQFEVNVVGLVAVTQSVLPLLRCGRGRVVNMGSIAGRLTTPYFGPYAASKHALVAATDALRLELRQWGVPVALVEPGAVATGIRDKALAAAEAAFERLLPEARRTYPEALPYLRSLAEGPEDTPPEVVASAVLRALTAARPKSRYVVGNDARIGMLLAHLPDRLRDRLLTRKLQGRESGGARDERLRPPGNYGG